MNSNHESAPRWRTEVTRWGWLAILLVAGLSLLLTPSDEVMLGSRVLLALALLAAGVGVAMKKRTEAKK